MWCTLNMFIMVLTDNVPIIRVNIFINLNNLSLIVIKFYGVQKLNLLLSPGRSLYYWPYFPC